MKLGCRPMWSASMPCSFGDDGAAEDGGDEQARAFAGERAEVLDAEGEDRREHDGVAEADGEHGAHMAKWPEVKSEMTDEGRRRPMAARPRASRS